MILLLVEYSLTVSPDDKLIDSQKRKLIELSAGVGDPRFHKVILLSILIYFSEENEIEKRKKRRERENFSVTYLLVRMSWMCKKKGETRI